MHDLTAMRVFVRVAEAGSFAAAARSLGLSTSVVSHHVAKLERSLGTVLLQRTTRRTGLTEAGARYLPRARAVVDECDALHREMRDLDATPSGRLRISVAPGIGQSLVMPAILGFMREHEAITVALDVTDRLVDLVAEGYDAAIRVGELEASSHKARRIADIRFTVCASPDYCARRGVPRHPRELVEHDIAHWFSRTGHSEWIFMDGAERIEVKVAGRLITNSVPNLHAAVRNGLCIAALPDFVIGPDLEDGRLVSLLDRYVVTRFPVWILWPDSHLESRKLRLAIDYIVTALAPYR